MLLAAADWSALAGGRLPWPRPAPLPAAGPSRCAWPRRGLGGSDAAGRAYDVTRRLRASRGRESGQEWPQEPFIHPRKKGFGRNATWKAAGDGG